MSHLTNGGSVFGVIYNANRVIVSKSHPELVANSRKGEHHALRGIGERDETVLRIERGRVPVLGVDEQGKDADMSAHVATSFDRVRQKQFAEALALHRLVDREPSQLHRRSPSWKLRRKARGQLRRDELARAQRVEAQNLPGRGKVDRYEGLRNILFLMLPRGSRKPVI